MFLPFYDVFISYAVEDRSIVESLARALRSQGLKVWYTHEKLSPGKGIYETVQYGLSNSRYGIALISPDYTGRWTHGELFSMQKRKDYLIPLLHRMSIEEGISKHPELANKFMMVSDKGLENISSEISKRVKTYPKIYYHASLLLAGVHEHKKSIFKWTAGFCFSALLVLAFLAVLPVAVDDEILHKTIKARVIEQQSQVNKELQERLLHIGPKICSMEELETIASLCKFSKASSKRNTISFSNGFSKVSSLAGLKRIGILSELGKLEVPFGLKKYRIYLLEKDCGEQNALLHYILINENATGYEIRDESDENKIARADVRYTEPLRYVEVTIRKNSENQLNSHISMLGFKVQETYLFVNRNDEWINTSVL